MCEQLVILHSGREITLELINTILPYSQASKPHRSLFHLPDEGIQFYDLEQDLIRQALAKSQGNQSHAARLLGMTRDTFLYRMRKYAITT